LGKRGKAEQRDVDSVVWMQRSVLGRGGFWGCGRCRDFTIVRLYVDSDRSDL
jgi:hypothetical protein